MSFTLISQFAVGIILVALCSVIWFQRTRTTAQRGKEQYRITLFILVPIIILGFAFLISSYFMHRL
jgi:hypothetical protein